MGFRASFSLTCLEEQKFLRSRKIGELALLARGSQAGFTLLTVCSRSGPLVALVRHCYSSDAAVLSPRFNPLITISDQGQTFLTPLFISIALDQTKISKRLIKAGAPLVLRDPQDTALHHATYHGSTAMVQHILKENLVDINSKDHFGYTAVFSAVMRPRPTNKMFQLLFEYGVDINKTITHVNRDLESPLSIACDQGKWLIAEPGCPIKGNQTARMCGEGRMD